MRLVDADKLIEAFEVQTGYELFITGDEKAVEWIKFFIDEIKYAPTIDAVEVVRCKDCKYSKHLKQYPKVNTWKCILTDVVYRADDFCSYGERKNED